MTDKKWPVLNEALVHEDPFLRIYKKIVQVPDGKTNDYYVLDKYVPFFSIIIPLTESHETYLIGQYRPATETYSWEFPMGSTRDAKKPEDTARQELQEETGFSAKLWHEAGKFMLAPGHCNQWAHVFVAQDLTAGDADPEPHEFLERKKLSIDEVGRMIERGEITDGPTIASYQMYVTWHAKQIS